MISDQTDTSEQTRNVYWMNDLKILYENKNYIRFFPTKNMTRIEQLNALARFSIYLFIIFIIMDRKDEWLFVPIIIIIMNIVLYNLFEIDENGEKKDLMRLRNQMNDSLVHDADNMKNHMKNINYNISTSYYDSNGVLESKPSNVSDGINEGFNKKYSLDENREFVKNNCMRPTENNPMMNQNVLDMNQDNISIKCDPYDVLVEQEVVEAFNKNLIRDANDLMGNQNSQRQFMPLNNMIPNEQEAFAKWCYGSPDACKANPLLCVRDNDMLGMYNSC